VEIHAHDREGKRRPRFKPISEIIRNAAGKPIGRILRRATGEFDAFGIGAFLTERAAVAAIRAKWKARR
jgi:hypothetical protein